MSAGHHRYNTNPKKNKNQERLRIMLYIFFFSGSVHSTRLLISATPIPASITNTVLEFPLKRLKSHSALHDWYGCQTPYWRWQWTYQKWRRHGQGRNRWFCFLKIPSCVLYLNANMVKCVGVIFLRRSNKEGLLHFLSIRSLHLVRCYLWGLLILKLKGFFNDWYAFVVSMKTRPSYSFEKFRLIIMSFLSPF